MSKKYQAGGGGSMGSNFGRTTAAGGTRGTRNTTLRGGRVKVSKSTRLETSRGNKAIKIGMKEAVKDNSLGVKASKSLRKFSKAQGGVSNSITPKGIKKAPVKPSSGRMNKKGKK